MARPRKKSHEKRSAELPTIRVLPSERVLIEDKAASAGMSLTNFVRDCVLYTEVQSRDEKPEVFLTDATPKIPLEASVMVELNRIGVNLNQIARARNSGRDDPNILQYALDELVVLMRKLDAAL